MSSICPSEEEQLQAEMYETLMIAYGQNNTIYNHTSKNNQTPKLAQTLKQKKDNKISSGPPKYDLNRKKFSNLNNSLKNNVTHLDGLEYMIKKDKHSSHRKENYDSFRTKRNTSLGLQHTKI